MKLALYKYAIIIIIIIIIIFGILCINASSATSTVIGYEMTQGSL